MESSLVAPSICLRVAFLKLNLTEIVAPIRILVKSALRIEDAWQKLAVVQSIITDLDGCFQWDICKQIRSIEGTAKDGF